MMTQPSFSELMGMISVGKPAEEVLEYAGRLEQTVKESRYENFCPIDFKYRHEELVPYLTPAAEARQCVRVHAALMDGLREFGLATEENVREVEDAVDKISPANVYFLEDNVTRHDQLAVIQETGNHISSNTKARMHPGTTSYDILDTARAVLYRDCMKDVFLPRTRDFLGSLVKLADEYSDEVQIGRTHDQWTSPVTFGFAVINYAMRVAERHREIDRSAGKLKGKISGIVGTRASTGTVVGQEKAAAFEKYVLSRLGLEPCQAASQVVHKEGIIDLAHYITTLDGVLADLSNSMRSLQRSEIAEVSQSDTKERLGGSSADPSKNNPIGFENVNGLWEDVVSGMMTMYHMQVSDHQRDLRGSVQHRYEPVHIVCSTYDSLKRLTKIMNALMVNPDAMKRHLVSANKYVAEPLNATLKAHRFPDAHERVKKLSQKAVKSGRSLLETALEDHAIQKSWDWDFTAEQKLHLQNLATYYGDAMTDTKRLVKELREEFSLKPTDL